MSCETTTPAYHLPATDGAKLLRLVDAPASAPSRNSLALAYGLTLSLEHVLYIRPAIDLLGAVLRREPRVYVVRVEDEDGAVQERWLDENDISELAIVFHTYGFAAAACEAERKGWL